MGQRISNAAYLLVSQSILSVAIHDLAGWEPAGESLYHALGRDALEKEGIPVLDSVYTRYQDYDKMEKS